MRRLPSTSSSYQNECHDYQMCIVFKVGDKNKNVETDFDQNKNISEFDFFQQKWSVFMDRLDKAGLEHNAFRSYDDENIFVFLRANEKRLKEEAERIEYELEFHPGRALAQAKEEDLRLAKETKEITQETCWKTMSRCLNRIEPVNMDSWKYLFGSFLPNLKNPKRSPNLEKFENRENLFKRYPENADGSLFRPVDCIKLLYVILEAPRKHRGCNMDLVTVCEDPYLPMVKVFPIHQPKECKELLSKMLRWNTLCYLPLDDIRNYFGEQVALYFAFLQFYTKLLFGPAILGSATFFWQMYSGNVSVPLLPVMGVAMCIWSTVFLEIWKRTESVLRGRWGMANFQSKEQPRASFVGVPVTSPIDGAEIQTVKFWQVVGKGIGSYSIISTLVVVVVGIVITIKVAQYFMYMNQTYSNNQIAYIGSIFNAIGIHGMNFIYGKVAHFLVDWENHKTDTDYENSKISKTFIFKFFNSYYSLFYIAFMQRSFSSLSADVLTVLEIPANLTSAGNFTNATLNVAEPASTDHTNCPVGDSDCMQLLRKQLGIIFAAQIVATNLISFLVPKIKHCKRKKSIDNNEDKPTVKFDMEDRTTAEHNYNMLDEYESPLQDYSEITIQFGYASLFVLAFPFAPVFALINNLIQLKLDAYNLCQDTLRPEPRGAFSIGSWYVAFEVLSYSTVITNTAILTLFVDGSYFSHETTVMKFMYFVLIEHILFFFKGMISYFIPDSPGHEETRLLRQRYITSTLLRGAMYDDDDSDDDDDDNDAFSNLKNRNYKKAKNVGTWLKKYELEKYEEQFHKLDYDLAQIVNLDETEITKMIQEIGLHDESDENKMREIAGSARRRREELTKKYGFNKLATYFDPKQFSEDTDGQTKETKETKEIKSNEDMEVMLHS